MVRKGQVSGYQVNNKVLLITCDIDSMGYYRLKTQNIKDKSKQNIAIKKAVREDTLKAIKNNWILVKGLPKGFFPTGKNFKKLTVRLQPEEVVLYFHWDKAEYNKISKHVLAGKIYNVIYNNSPKYLVKYITLEKIENSFNKEELVKISNGYDIKDYMIISFTYYIKLINPGNLPTKQDVLFNKFSKGTRLYLVLYPTRKMDSIKSIIERKITYLDRDNGFNKREKVRLNKMIPIFMGNYKIILKRASFYKTPLERKYYEPNVRYDGIEIK